MRTPAQSSSYRRAVFNVLAHNRDDHVKNFAFRLREGSEWELSPAYDVVFSQGPGGEHSTTVAGQGRAPGRDDLLRLAESAGLVRREATEILDEVAAAVAGWAEHAGNAGVGGARSREIGAVLAECGARVRGL